MLIDGNLERSKFIVETQTSSSRSQKRFRMDEIGKIIKFRKYPTPCDFQHKLKHNIFKRLRLFILDLVSLEVSIIPVF